MESALEDDLGSKKVEKHSAAFGKHDNDINKHNGTYNNVSLQMQNYSHIIEEDDFSVYVESKAKFGNTADIPNYMELLDVQF